MLLQWIFTGNLDIHKFIIYHSICYKFVKKINKNQIQHIHQLFDVGFFLTILSEDLASRSKVTSHNTIDSRPNSHLICITFSTTFQFYVEVCYFVSSEFQNFNQILSISHFVEFFFKIFVLCKYFALFLSIWFVVEDNTEKFSWRWVPLCPR